MPLTCNIDARGKFVRLVWGIALLILGLVLLFAWAVPSNAAWPWVATVLCLLGGAFAIFEARAGWCVVRGNGVPHPHVTRERVGTALRVALRPERRWCLHHRERRAHPQTFRARSEDGPHVPRPRDAPEPTARR
jgi:hypothetical protein